MNDLILNKIKSSIQAPQFLRVYFEDLPIGCLPLYDFNREEDTPLTFGFEHLVYKPSIIKAKDFFGRTPPRSNNRVLPHLIVGDKAIEDIVISLLIMDKEFCKSRELIICYRQVPLYPEYGFLIRQPLKPKKPVTKMAAKNKFSLLNFLSNKIRMP